MEVKIIKTESDYQEAVQELDRLIEFAAESESSNANKIEVLALLIEDYEQKHWQIGLPDPIAAIEFVMEQKDLSPRDLIPYIGSRSKVSEVLSRKRPLSLAMMKALHKHLGIPAEIFLQQVDAEFESDGEIEWSHFPLREMRDRGWISGSLKQIQENAQEIVSDFLKPIGGFRASPVLYRKKIFVRAPRTENPYSLEAWRAWVMREALAITAKEYRSNLIDLDFLSSVGRFSRPDNGPLLVREFLQSYGIILIVQPHLSKTYLDGASFFANSGNPIVALTLRYDRLDHFWFVLMHELVHVWRHLKKDQIEFIVDDLDVEASDRFETEADELAREALVPKAIFLDSEAYNLQSVAGVNALADRCKIHPAIVAGMVRYETGNYRKLNQMVGYGEVRKLFGF